jgi:hypothetical protein
MRRTLLLLFGIVAANVGAGGSRILVRGTAHAQNAELKPNACEISCPAGTAYPGLAGAVTCREGFAPACQCTNPDERMAGCQKLPSKP